MNNVKVVIIGSGAAGIAAASRLFENGFNNVTVLEAENTIGGRINSIEFGNGIVELGAQWCHGERGNVVYDMVKNMNLLEPSIHNYFYMNMYESSGKLIEKSVTDKLFDMWLDIDENSDAHGGSGSSYGEYFTERYIFIAFPSH